MLDEIKQRYSDCRELQYINLKMADPAKSHISAEADFEWLIGEIERLRAALQRISEWDSLNPPDPRSDFPWLKRLVDEALGCDKAG